MSPTLSTETARRVAEGFTQLLADFVSDSSSPLGVDVQQAVYLARQLQIRAAALQTPVERRQQA